MYPPLFGQRRGMQDHLTELLDSATHRSYSGAILQPGPTGSAAGGASPGKTTGAWLGRRAKSGRSATTVELPVGIDPRGRSRGSSSFWRKVRRALGRRGG